MPFIQYKFNNNAYNTGTGGSSYNLDISGSISIGTNVLYKPNFQQSGYCIIPYIIPVGNNISIVPRLSSFNSKFNNSQT